MLTLKLKNASANVNSQSQHGCLSRAVAKFNRKGLSQFGDNLEFTNLKVGK